jgi:hypothetical protein
VIFLLFVLRGFLEPLVHDGSAMEKGLNLVTGIALAVLLVQWCEYDCEERGIKRWRYFAVMMIICPGPLILMPIYFLATRGWRGLLSILKAALCFTLAAGATGVGFVVSWTVQGGWKLFPD